MNKINLFAEKHGNEQNSKVLISDNFIQYSGTRVSATKLNLHFHLTS
jgi:hypothetical protein